MPQYPKEINLGEVLYIILAKLGEGTYGVVFKAQNTVTKEAVAIKKIKSEFDSEGLSSTSLREISLLKQLSHPNVVKLQYNTYFKGNVYMVFEYCDTDLRKFLDSQTRPISLNLIKNYCYQLFQGVLQCHTNRILHRDLKPQNILIDVNKGVVKIADFGLARTYSVPIKPLTHEVVTLWYRAPEILLHSSLYACGVDVWSAACIFAEFVLPQPLFMGDCEIDQIFTIFRALGTPNVQTWPGFKECSAFNEHFPVWSQQLPIELLNELGEVGVDLLSKMLTYNTTQRISIRNSLKHKFFSEVNETNVPSYGAEYDKDRETIIKKYMDKV